jgi:altronate hydrolase
MDSDALCGLLAGYITHPNVAGATVLSLGCQHAQASILKAEIEKRSPGFDRRCIFSNNRKKELKRSLCKRLLRQLLQG